MRTNSVSLESNGLNWCGKKQGTTFEKQNLVSIVKYGGGGVIFMRCIAASAVDRLTFIDSTLDHMRYSNILKENLKLSHKI